MNMLGKFTAVAAGALMMMPSAQALDMNLGHTLTLDSPFHIGAQKFADLLKERSNGEINITVFPHSQLGGELTMIQGAQMGTEDVLVTGQSTLTNTAREFLIFDIPYLFDSVEQANEILNGPVGDKFLDVLPNYGLVGLGWFSSMERNVFASRAIESADDFNGMKLRVIQSPGYVESYNALGAQATPMAYADLYLALQQHVIDGADTSPDQFVSDKFIEVSKFYNVTRVHYMPALLIMSKSRWDSFSPEEQEMVQGAADDAMAHAQAYYGEVYDKAMVEMAAAGVTIVKTDVTSLVEATAPVARQLIDQIPNGQEFYDAVMAAKN
ncbi:MAG: C4-dicarboxylate ABC transporter substrate-binding protein [Pelagibacterium sp. SCN 64-44]|nr:MAG: C4-dicarboxylate ABC transporter substrate-binding protein [Pelagibacterium sp. SCN 64-44]